MRTWAWIGILSGALLAQSGSAGRQVQRLTKQAKKQQDKVKELWKKFVFTPRDTTDDEVKQLITAYERAIDAYQQALEASAADSGFNAAILVLSKRVAELRMVEMGRAYRRKPKPKRPPPETPPRTEPQPERPPRETGPAEEDAVPEPTPEEVAAKLTGLPSLEEPKAARRRGVQGVRNFLMNHYLPPRKYGSMVVRCPRCNGYGKYTTGRLSKNRKPEYTPCSQCGQNGFHLNETNARKGHWLCWSPLYRSDPGNRERWTAEFAAWRADPRRVPEYLKTVRIVKVDYHGLWAEVTWQEKGVSADRRKFTRDVTRKLIRAGRRWFFYDETFDRNFFAPDPDSRAG